MQDQIAKKRKQRQLISDLSPELQLQHALEVCATTLQRSLAQFCGMRYEDLSKQLNVCNFSTALCKFAACPQIKLMNGVITRYFSRLQKEVLDIDQYASDLPLLIWAICTARFDQLLMYMFELYSDESWDGESIHTATMATILEEIYTLPSHQMKTTVTVNQSMGELQDYLSVFQPVSTATSEQFPTSLVLRFFRLRPSKMWPLTAFQTHMRYVFFGENYWKQVTSAARTQPLLDNENSLFKFTERLQSIQNMKSSSKRRRLGSLLQSLCELLHISPMTVTESEGEAWCSAGSKIRMFLEKLLSAQPEEVATP